MSEIKVAICGRGGGKRSWFAQQLKEYIDKGEQVVILPPDRAKDFINELQNYEIDKHDDVADIFRYNMEYLGRFINGKQ